MRRDTELREHTVLLTHSETAREAARFFRLPSASAALAAAACSRTRGANAHARSVANGHAPCPDAMRSAQHPGAEERARRRP